MRILGIELRVEFDNGRLTQNIILSFRAVEDEVIWMSASMIVPIAKILMTNERFVFYEKFQKIILMRNYHKYQNC